MSFKKINKNKNKRYTRQLQAIYYSSYKRKLSTTVFKLYNANRINIIQKSVQYK